MRDSEEGAMTGGHPDEGTIHAWLDGALPAGEAAAFEAHVAGCAACAAAVAEARGLLAASSRILGALDHAPGGVLPRAAEAPAGDRPDVVPLRPARAAPARRHRTGWTLSAAAVALLAVGTWAVVGGDGTERAMEMATSASPAADEAGAADAALRRPAPAADGAAASEAGLAAGAAPTVAPAEAAPDAGPASAKRADPAPAVAAAPSPPPSPPPSSPPPPAMATAADAAAPAAPDRGVVLRGPSRLAGGGVTVTGQVTSDAGRPVAGASVAAAVAGAAASTDTAGRFSLVVPPGTDSLRVLRQGFAPAQVAVDSSAGDSARVRVTLRADVRSLAGEAPAGVATAGVAPAGVAIAGPATALAGCYRVDLERSAGAAPIVDGVERALPGWILLAPDTLAAAPWRAAGPLPVAGAQAAPATARGRWRPADDGAVVEWRGTEGAVALRLRAVGDDLSGTAAPEGAAVDAVGVPVTLRRAACP